MLRPMAQRDAYLEHLSSVPLFSACSRRELQKIAKASEEMHFEEGKELVQQGATGREAFIILNGTAGVKRSNRKIATLGPGECFGELSLLDHGPRTATVVAESPMDVLVLESRKFAGVLDEIPTMARKLMGALATRVRDLDSKAFG